MEMMESRLALLVRGTGQQAAPLARVLASVARDAAEQQRAVAVEVSAAQAVELAAHKERGNALFKAGEHQAALLEYGTGLRGLTQAALAMSNRAACIAEQNLSGGSEDVVINCIAALAVDAGHVKSCHRCALALLKLNWQKEAQASFNFGS